MRNRLIPVIILGVSLIVSSAVFGVFFYRSRLPQKTVRVVGAATQRFESDVVKWRVTLNRNTGLGDVKSGYDLINRDCQTFVSLMTANGIAEKDISVQPINTNQMMNQNGPTGYNIQQSIYLVSRDIPTVERLALNPGALSDRGIILQSSSLEYYFSKLPDIKKEMLAAATRDAQSRAVEIAKSTGDKIDKIESARVGVFQITEPYSTEVADYGVYNTSTRIKDITVTVNVVFTLR